MLKLAICESKEQLRKRLEIMAIYSRQMSAYALDLADMIEEKHVVYNPFKENPFWMTNRINQLAEIADKIDGILATI